MCVAEGDLRSCARFLDASRRPSSGVPLLRFGLPRSEGLLLPGPESWAPRVVNPHAGREPLLAALSPILAKSARRAVPTPTRKTSGYAQKRSQLFGGPWDVAHAHIRRNLQVDVGQTRGVPRVSHAHETLVDNTHAQPEHPAAHGPSRGLYSLKEHTEDATLRPGHRVEIGSPSPIPKLRSWFCSWAR